MEIQHIKTAGDIRRGVAHLLDDQPVQFSLNNVPTNAYFEPPGVEGRRDTTIIIDANYTCYRTPAHYAAEGAAKAQLYGGGDRTPAGRSQASRTGAALSASRGTGCADPVATQGKLRADDPRKAEKIAIFDAWKSRIGVGKDRRCYTKEIIDAADDDQPLREALLAVAAQRFALDRKIDPKALGKWLARQEGAIAANCKLLADRTNVARPRWYLDFL